ncbi:MAG TPA: TonB-dependent receptor, partial [Elusimicrobiales bacterium]|nr:TonB-dependent receptor [Elusimicrobiales bacterium]
RIMFGQEYENTPRRFQSNYDVSPFVTYLDKNSPVYRWAMYAQQELSPLPALNLTLGLRYDRYKSFGNALNPRAAAVYRLGDEDTAKLLYGSAFRAPNTFEMDYKTATAAENPELKPEKVSTYEAVYEHSLPDKGFVTVSYFHNRIYRLISQITGADGLLQFVNSGRIKTQGMEISSKFALRDGIYGHIGYTLQDTREIGHEHMTNSPVHVAAAGLSRRIPSCAATISAEGFFIGDRRTVKDTTLHATALLNLLARARPWKKGPLFYAGIYNATNAPYYVSGAGEHLQAAIRQDGRNYTVGIEHRF